MLKKSIVFYMIFTFFFSMSQIFSSQKDFIPVTVAELAVINQRLGQDVATQREVLSRLEFELGVCKKEDEMHRFKLGGDITERLQIENKLLEEELDCLNRDIAYAQAFVSKR